MTRSQQPQPYNMKNPEDRERWYRQMKQYLSLAGEDNFLIQGTDRKGRRFAWDAFTAIAEEFTTHTDARKDNDMLDKLADLIDAHAKSWNELCEMQQLVKKLRNIQKD